MSLSDILHKILDVAAGDNARQDLHDEIDALDEDSAVEPAPGVPAEAGAPGPDVLPVPAPEPAVDDGAQVQAQVQEGDDGAAES